MNFYRGRGPLILLALFLGCARTQPAAVYAPTESILEVVAVLRLHIDDDTYRFPPARDFTGKGVFRSSFDRLESLEQIHEEKLRSGHLQDVVLFAKGRALERITEYDLAARHYGEVEKMNSPLAPAAQQGRAVNERIAAADRVRPASGAQLSEVLADFEDRQIFLEELEREVDPSHYVYVVREELERNDVARAEYLRARRRIQDGLDALALRQYQRLVQRNQKSKYRNRHLLDLGDLYAELSRDYARRVAPSSLGFDTVIFDEYAFGATRLFEAVSQQDGALEKIEASRKLEAFLAFTLQVHDEHFPY